MFNVNFNLIVTDNCFVFIGLLRTGASLVVVCCVSFATAFGCLSLTMQLLLFRKNHARLACSVVNALTTAHCRYQLLRISDRGKPCPYGLWVYFNLCEAPTSFNYSLFTLLCPIGLMSRGKLFAKK